MALSILPMFAFEASRGEVADPVAPGIFMVIAVVATLLTGRAALPSPQPSSRPAQAI